MVNWKYSNEPTTNLSVRAETILFKMSKTIFQRAMRSELIFIQIKYHFCHEGAVIKTDLQQCDQEKWKALPSDSLRSQAKIYSFHWLDSHTKGSCEYHEKAGVIFPKRLLLAYFPLLRGFLWMPLPWRSGRAICFGCTGEFITALTAPVNGDP